MHIKFDLIVKLFYCPDINSDQYRLPDEEARHAVQVLRLNVGDMVQLIDGKGGLYQAELFEVGKKWCSVQILSKKEQYGKRNFSVHLAVALTKHTDRFEWFIEKATELGIEQISPILCDFSERKQLKSERSRAIAISAIKQSYKAYLPDISELMPLSTFLQKSNFQGQKFIAHCYEGEKPHLKNLCQKAENVLVLIGPEGDFSHKEIELAKRFGFLEISLSPARLRTETAALAACHIINLANE